MSGYDQERIANLQYEAGMYESLYENAKTRIEALEAALREIMKIANDDDEPDWLNTLDRLNDVARAALAPEQDK
jgi:N-methylhydantoinase B/oxoprolinase/acetone carboxylase alpha subunit